MKHGVVGIVLTAAIVFGGAQVLGNLSGIASSPTVVVAHADATATQSGVMGDGADACHWQVSSDGVLHIGTGTLPEASKTEVERPIGTQTYWWSPFYDLLLKLNDSGLTIKTISLEGRVKAPVNASYLFAQLDTFEPTENGTGPQIKNLGNLDVSQSTNLSYMFLDADQEVIDVSNFDTSHVDNMRAMFCGNERVKKFVGLDKLDTSHVKDMGKMFDDVGIQGQPLTLDLSHFDVSNVGITSDEENDYGVKETGFDDMIGAPSNCRLTVNISSWQPKIPLDNLFNNYYENLKVVKLTLGPNQDLTNADLPDIWSIDPNNNEKTPYTGKWENVKDLYSTDTSKVRYSPAQLMALYGKDSAKNPQNIETYVWEPDKTPGNPVKVHFVNQAGNTIQADQSVPGDMGADYTVTPQKIQGYQFLKAINGSLTGTFTSDAQEVTLVYKAAPVAPANSSVVSGKEETSSSDSTSSEPDTANKTFSLSKKDQAVTAVKKLGLYESPNFTKRARKFYYSRQSRLNRYQFVITGMAQSSNGTPRYLVKDVTQGSKRRGQPGYVTANEKFWVHTYYQTTPKTVKVIATKGVDAYKKMSLTGDVKHYRQGKVLRVKQIKRYHLTTRLVLRNGWYITANKNYVVER